MYRFRTFNKFLFSDPTFVLFLVLLTIARGYYGYSQGGLPLSVDYPMHIPVMLATGRGFVEPVGMDTGAVTVPNAPELGRFLRQEIPQLHPGDIPADFPTRTPTYSWVFFHRYMYQTVGFLWRVFGISWGVVLAFRIALLCIMEAAAYGLLRFGMRRSWSLVGALILFATYFHYSNSLRDFSKAAFILTAMFILVWLITHPVRRSRFLTLACLLGLVVGVGFGFRADILACLPASAFVLACCARPDSPGPRLRRMFSAGLERLAAMLLLAGVFTAVGWPVLLAYQGNHLSAHDFTKGLATEYDNAAGVGSASYERISLNDDVFVSYTFESHSARALPSHTPSSDINARREGFVRQILQTFPGDLVTRAYCSVLWVLRGGMLAGAQNRPPVFLTGFMALCAAAALLLTARRDLRRALILFILLFYFGGYLSIQADQRHGFHLAFIPLLIAGFVLERTVSAFWKTVAARRGMQHASQSLRGAPHQSWRPTVKRVTLFTAVTIPLLLVPLHVTRAVQHHAVERLLPQYARADLEPVALEPHPLGDWVVLRRPAVAPPHSGTLDRPDQECHAGYWMVEFAGGTAWHPIFLRYECARGGNDFSQGLWVRPGSAGDAGAIRYFFPVYENTDIEKRGWSVFAGVVVLKDQIRDFRGLYRVRNDSQFPLFLNLSLPAETSSFQYYQAVLGQTPPVWDNGADIRSWIPKDAGLQIPGPNDIAQLPEPDKTIKGFTDALKMDAGSPVLRLGLAAALEAKGDAPTALETYRRTLEASPKFYVTYHYLDAFFKRNNTPDARAAQWRAEAQAHPDNWLPCFHLALALEEQQDREGALEAYRQVLALNPNDAQTWTDVGRLLLAKDDKTGAEDAFRQALQLDPGSPGALKALGDLKEQGLK
jgi:hypothetical protein